MLIGVVSDTHGHLENTRRAVVMLQALEVELVLHCGDIGSPAIPPLFDPWPAHYVLGNVDYDEAALKDAISRAGGTFHGRFGSLDVDGRRIAFLHGDDQRRFRAELRSGTWDLVCYGHTHQAEEHHEGRTLVLNPGALFRARPHTLAVVDTATLRATTVSID